MSTRIAWTTTASILLLAGCQGAVNVEGSLPEVMAEGRGATVSADGALSVEAGDAILIVDRARMMLSELEIEGRTEASEVEVGPEVLELGLDGDPTFVAVSDVPAGKYQELGLEMQRGSDADAEGSEDFGGESPASIIVDGEHQGEPFTFRSRYAAELEFGLGGLRVRDGETATVTVTFDVAAWFLDADGNILDPSNPDNHAKIDGNIAASVAAYAEEEGEDDD